MTDNLDPDTAAALAGGTVIPAHPLALTADRLLDEDGQRRLTRYYADAGVGGIAVGVHTTQFEIRDPAIGLYEPVLRLAAEELDAGEASIGRAFVRVAGLVGPTASAVAEAETAVGLGYHLGLLSMAGWGDAPEPDILAGVEAVTEVIDVFGFYLQPAVGGRLFSPGFWHEFVQIPGVRAIKVAPFDRYATIDVVRAVAEAGRAGDLALYTGNDDNIVADLLTGFRFSGRTLRVVGGLLGQWAVWPAAAVELLEAIKALGQAPVGIPADLLTVGADLTDANAAVFDAANGFAGCIPGINEVLRREGVMAGRWCLDPALELSPGQAEAIDRVTAAYPHLTDAAAARTRLGVTSHAEIP